MTGAMLSLAPSSRQGHPSQNRTRQGSARERTLKPAGHFIPSPTMQRGDA